MKTKTKRPVTLTPITLHDATGEPRVELAMLKRGRKKAPLAAVRWFSNGRENPLGSIIMTPAHAAQAGAWLSQFAARYLPVLAIAVALMFTSCGAGQVPTPDAGADAGTIEPREYCGEPLCGCIELGAKRDDSTQCLPVYSCAPAMNPDDPNEMPPCNTFCAWVRIY